MKHLILFLILLTSFAYPQSDVLLLSDDVIDTTGYWVDGTNGNDSWDGNYSYPFKTLDQANTSADAGSTVNVRAGTYIEDDATTHNFIATKKLRWVGHGVVRIKSVSTTYVFQTTTADTIWFTNFIFDGGDSTSTLSYFQTSINYISNCTFISSKASTLGMYVLTGGVRITGSTFNIANCTYVADFRKGSSISSSTINLTTCANVFRLRSTAVMTVRDNTISGTMTSAGYIFTGEANTELRLSKNIINITSATFGSLYYDGGLAVTPVYIDSNTVSGVRNTLNLINGVNSTGRVYYIRNNNINITGSALDDNIISLANSICTISGNTIETNTVNASIPIIINSTGTDMSGCSISSNTIRQRNKTGYSICVGAEGTTAGDNQIDTCLIEGNTIYGSVYYTGVPTDVTIHAIFVGFQQRPIIRYNKVNGSGYGIVDKGSNSYAGQIYYNQMVNCWQGIRFKGVKKGNVYNNTVYNSIDNGYRGIYLSENTGSDGSDSTIIKNNIIYNSHSGATDTYCILVDTASNDGLISDYNCFYNLSDNQFALEDTVRTFVQWQGLGYDTNGLNVDPEFTSVTDYSLQATSDCIDAGTDVSLTVDILGNPVGASPDIGAYEKQ